MAPAFDMRSARFRAEHDRFQAEYDRNVERLRSLVGGVDRAVVIEQAKGVIAERRGITFTAAFEEIRRQARSHNVTVADVAADIVASVCRRAAS